MQFGSMQNHLLGNSVRDTKPEIGMGATEIMYSDRHPYTIVEILDENKIVVQRDKAVRTDKWGMSEVQEYKIDPDSDGAKMTVIRHKNGRWLRAGDSPRDPGSVFLLGARMKYYDYSR